MIMKSNGVKQKYSNQKKTPDLDCTVCLERQTCPNAQEGKFCGRFHSKTFDPAARGVDPIELWERGEEVEFDS